MDRENDDQCHFGGILEADDTLAFLRIWDQKFGNCSGHSMHTHAYLYVYTCLHTYVCIYTYIDIDVCTYIYICTVCRRESPDAFQDLRFPEASEEASDDGANFGGSVPQAASVGSAVPRFAWTDSGQSRVVQMGTYRPLAFQVVASYVGQLSS